MVSTWSVEISDVIDFPCLEKVKRSEEKVLEGRMLVLACLLLIAKIASYFGYCNSYSTKLTISILVFLVLEYF